MDAIKKENALKAHADVDNHLTMVLKSLSKSL